MYPEYKNIPPFSVSNTDGLHILIVIAPEVIKMLFSELKCKDVINTRDCKKLGKVCDLEFDPCSGCICKIMVPGCNRVLSFLNCEPNIVIPFKDICQIGPDIILVDIHC